MLSKKVAIIGLGEMGKRHALEFSEASKGFIKICGVVEPDSEKYRQGNEWNKTVFKRYDSIPELLVGAQPDGIIITSPNHTHWEILHQLESFDGVIMIEKPLDVNMERMCRIFEFARNRKAPVLVDHVMRFAPIIRKAKDLISTGAIGKVCSFDFILRNNGGSRVHTFRRSRRTGGGQMIEKATHDLDVAMFLTGSVPEKVIMISKRQRYGGDKPEDLHCCNCKERLNCDESVFNGVSMSDVPDVACSNDFCAYSKDNDISDNEMCLLQFSNNVFGHYSHNFFQSQPGRSRCYEIIGTHGVIFMELADRMNQGKIHLFPRNNPDCEEIFTFNYNNKIHYQGGIGLGKHFYNLMIGKETIPFTNVPDAFLVEATGIAAMISAEEKRFVSVKEVIPVEIQRHIK